ncbi:uncharacterized protein CXQ87_000440 [Candidozyma duobushaemuli]|uniref:Methyltransferase type 11 domain-containing protein n=1 Tax=Candidozyma duobushaemuli TaxID=1231522 RepID=A0A2V1AKW2_9ASCO|nr:uncharacterized protein CXQ87_000440 [[Candida] duobushaemulonis]PVH17551.1 hypothetical protein CXQ87_000440 [[Candida] duobushaemulonis]
MIKRGLATATKGQFTVFDRAAKLSQRNRAALHPEISRKADYLRDEVSLRTVERLGFILREFPRVLDFGCHSGNFLKSLCKKSEVPPGGDHADVEMTKQLNEDKVKIKSKIQELVMLDSSESMLFRDVNEDYLKEFPGKVQRIVADEESFDHEVLQPESFDAVISNLSLHWINDLPQILKNINTVLNPDGMFMGTLFGGDTLYELRTSLQLAELERRGGMSQECRPWCI